jgi:hypothetical protein
MSDDSQNVSSEFQGAKTTGQQETSHLIGPRWKGDRLHIATISQNFDAFFRGHRITTNKKIREISPFESCKVA